jgi:hypothetical protein
VFAFSSIFSSPFASSSPVSPWCKASFGAIITRHCAVCIPDRPSVVDSSTNCLRSAPPAEGMVL